MANTNKLIDLSKLSRFWDKVKEIIGDLTALTTSDKSSLVGAVNEIASYTPVYGNTASGSIATFDTSLALPLQDCTIKINAVQESGTPTPSSPKLISGFTGANITDIGANWFHQTAWSETANGITVPTETNINANLYNGKLPKGTFYIKDFTGGSNTTHQIVVIKDGTVLDYVTSNTYTLTVDDNNYNSTWIIRLYLYTGNTVSPIKPIMTTISPVIYKPYVAPTTTAISWQDEAGTVYGGLLDVTSGVLTVTWGSVDLTTLSWIYSSTYSRFESTVVSDIKTPANNNTVINGLCSIYPLDTSNNTASAGKDNIIGCATNGKLQIRDTSLSGDTSALETRLTGVTFVYELATPLTYQLTPTQISAIVGTNNVFTDTNGDTSVIYACSLKDYIDRQ